MMWNVYSTSEHNYQMFNKIQAKSSFGLQHGGHYKPYYFVENQSAIKYLP